MPAPAFVGGRIHSPDRRPGRGLGAQSVNLRGGAAGLQDDGFRCRRIREKHISFAPRTKIECRRTLRRVPSRQRGSIWIQRLPSRTQSQADSRGWHRPRVLSKARREFFFSFAFHPPRGFPHPISPWIAKPLGRYPLSVFEWRTHPVPIMMHITAGGDMRHGAVCPQEM